MSFTQRRQARRKDAKKNYTLRPLLHFAPLREIRFNAGDSQRLSRPKLTPQCPQALSATYLLTLRRKEVYGVLEL